MPRRPKWCRTRASWNARRFIWALYAKGENVTHIKYAIERSKLAERGGPFDDETIQKVINELYELPPALVTTLPQHVQATREDLREEQKPPEGIPKQADIHLKGDIHHSLDPIRVELTRASAEGLEGVPLAKQEKHKLAVRHLVEKFKEELGLADFIKGISSEVHTLKPRFPYEVEMTLETPEGFFRFNFICEKLKRGMRLRCPTECREGFDWVREHFDDTQLWEDYTKWMETGGRLLQKFIRLESKLGTQNFLLPDILLENIYKQAGIAHLKAKMKGLRQRITERLDSAISEAGGIPGQCSHCPNWEQAKSNKLPKDSKESGLER